MAKDAAELFGDTEPTAEPVTPVTETTVETPTQAATQPPAIVQPEPLKPAEPARPDPGYVPIAAVLDEREKRQRVEKERDELRAQHRQPQNIPSAHDDPDAFAAHIQQQITATEANTRFSFSERFAEKDHGKEVVDAAKKWAYEKAKEEKDRLGFSPFGAEYYRHEHPIDWAVRQHKREKLVSEIGDDPDAWVRQRYAALNPTPPAAPQAQPQATPAAPQPVAQPATPRPSLASAPSAGGLQTHVAPKDKDLERLGLD